MKVEILEKSELKRKFKFSIPAKPLLEKIDNKIEEEAKTFKMAGFREGKVPVNIVRKRIGANVLSSVIETSVDETLKSYFETNSIRPALQPFVEIVSFDDKSDLVFDATIEVFPDLPKVTWDTLEIEMFDVDITDEDLKKAHEDILKNFKNFNKADDAYKAQKVMQSLLILLQLASKPAVFEVKVHEVLKPESVSDIDDDFAKKLGLENLDKLNEMIKQKIKADFEGLARLRTKKLLFDLIDEKYQFSVPEGMFKLDFDMMWSEVKKQHEKNPSNFNKPLNELEEDYKKIAARRVRLGILLAETATENNINVDDKDLQQAVYAEAMQRPGQEKLVIDFYSNKDNLERLKRLILEEKAVDFILTKVKTNKKKITLKELLWKKLY
ncbi:hypothetical protein RFI_20447 [Reticulomyxa filosa]|uniref:peptidylprolyl isomerase n=1 Tax=Reticulomyxa filosa TaxID=46433 RepID=X6MU00_RETFI|nr:hypothetical protein RFI_20447 [Reticulomyxa filosa]|eukprot:ETO16892.1 hypothetical protein RFI_20447 [Reticulomyxa filosa]